MAENIFQNKRRSHAKSPSITTKKAAENYAIKKAASELHISFRDATAKYGHADNLLGLLMAAEMRDGAAMRLSKNLEETHVVVVKHVKGVSIVKVNTAMKNGKPYYIIGYESQHFDLNGNPLVPGNK